MTVVELLKSQLIPLTDAVLCVNCGIVSDAGGETCPGCAGRGGLLNLAVHRGPFFLGMRPNRARSRSKGELLTHA